MCFRVGPMFILYVFVITACQLDPSTTAYWRTPVYSCIGVVSTQARAQNRHTAPKRNNNIVPDTRRIFFSKHHYWWIIFHAQCYTYTIAEHTIL